MQDNSADITRLLQAWRAGDREAEDQLFSLVFPRLRRLAHYLMKGERQGHSMQSTELVDEVYTRLVAARNQDWRNRQHFYALTARIMRRYLIDHARGRPRANFVPLEEMDAVLPADKTKIELAITIDRLLEQMTQAQSDWCTLVEMKFFLGLSDEETADAMGIKLRTMQRMWCEARQWLFERAGARSAGQSAG